MSFNDNANLDTSQVESGGSGVGRGGLAVGGGVGGIVVLILTLLFGATSPMGAPMAASTPDRTRSSTPARSSPAVHRSTTSPSARPGPMPTGMCSAV